MTEVRHDLPDGSVCVVDTYEWNASLISREVDDECMWGQAFSRNDDHAGQVEGVVAGMRMNPAAFVSLCGKDGRPR